MVTGLLKFGLFLYERLIFLCGQLCKDYAEKKCLKNLLNPEFIRFRVPTFFNECWFAKEPTLYGSLAIFTRSY